MLEFVCMFGLSLAIVAILAVVGTIWLRIRDRRIAASRLGETFDTFCESFTADEAALDVLQAVYGMFQNWCSFPIRADDDIAGVYGMVDEDLDDAVLEVRSECGRQLPPEEEIQQTSSVVTVRDFVRFVETCPKQPSLPVSRT